MPIGSDLHRPECVLATYRGDLFTSDSRGGVMHIRLGPGGFPDGLALDAAGAVWVTCVVGDRVVRVDPTGRTTTWYATSSPGHVATAEQAYLAGTLGAEHLTDRRSSPLGGCSSIAFAGPARTTAVLGSLFNDHLVRFDVQVAGAEPPHGRYPRPADRKRSNSLRRS